MWFNSNYIASCMCYSHKYFIRISIGNITLQAVIYCVTPWSNYSMVTHWPKKLVAHQRCTAVRNKVQESEESLKQHTIVIKL